MTPAIYELTAVQVRFGSRIVLDIDYPDDPGRQPACSDRAERIREEHPLGRLGLFEKARPWARDLLRFAP